MWRSNIRKAIFHVRIVNDCLLFVFQLDRGFDASVAGIDIKSEELFCFHGMQTTNIDAYNTTTENSAVEYNGNIGFLQNNFRDDDTFSVGSSVNPFENLLNSLDGSNNTNAVGNTDITGPVINRRRRSPIQSQVHSSGVQGIAPRRIRLQTKLEVGMSRASHNKEESEVRNLPREPNH